MIYSQSSEEKREVERQQRNYGRNWDILKITNDTVNNKMDQNNECWFRRNTGHTINRTTICVKANENHNASGEDGIIMEMLKRVGNKIYMKLRYQRVGIIL